MKENNPRRYKVAGLGGWGIVDGLIYENWREEAFDVQAISKRPDVKSYFGLDFGYTNDPTALFCGLVNQKEKTIWVFDELYEKALTNRAICETVTRMGYAKERIKADSAEPKMKMVFGATSTPVGFMGWMKPKPFIVKPIRNSGQNCQILNGFQL